MCKLSKGIPYTFLVFLHGSAFSQPAFPSTETLALAARHYMFFAAPTTYGLVTISLPKGTRPTFVPRGGNEIRCFSGFLLYWPGKDFGAEDVDKCRKVFLDVHKKVAPGIVPGDRRDLAVYNLCKARMSHSAVEFQWLTLNEAILKRLREEFPGSPPPIGLHVLSESVIPCIYLY